MEIQSVQKINQHMLESDTSGIEDAAYVKRVIQLFSVSGE
jgi:hypothetical protein